MIEVDHLSKTYGSTAAIKDVSFTVEPGEILGFLGPNGAGKTTTMRILTGYLPATGGTARVAGKDVHADSMAVRQSIGYLPETPPLYPEMTVEGFLYFVARIKGVPAGELAGRVTSAIERCNLPEKRSVIIRKLSKGFRQRVGIAQAIVHNPPVIVLDEPTVGLDPRQIIEVRNLIKSLAGEHTIILSTHILPEVSATCDRITIINQGKIIATDSPEHLTARISGQSGYWVELAGQVESSLSVLRAVPGVMGVSPMDTDELAAGHVRYQVTTGTEDVGGAIARAVVTAGLELFELSRNRASLEDVFMDLTMQETAAPEEDIDPASVFNILESSSPADTKAENPEEEGTQTTHRDDSLDQSPAERASEVIEAAKARLRDNKPSQFDASADEEST
ncbi:MAG: ABC transporter ATP-binding protein [Cyanobacteria bacterium J06597_16]